MACPSPLKFPANPVVDDVPIGVQMLSPRAMSFTSVAKADFAAALFALTCCASHASSSPYTIRYGLACVPLPSGSETVLPSQAGDAVMATEMVIASLTVTLSVFLA